ncbi:hypothetical protein MHM93_00085 [Pseudoalteromonas sp. MM17-2]|uniref:hypothetical protein n=1 Tax=Pseudoalteromonas sp. MM17-2 TaxID=2917753 RepID=UPI001EF4774D|nr:hypothetical protein [Pseudoalteromonas sp. MM17-2]MCG7542577.1 hypothetical protein [Pseudoalteromonas sp. MM17-2]
MRKVLAVLIVAYIAYGWFGSFWDKSEGANKLEKFSNLTVEDIVSIEAINSDYINMTNLALNSAQAKELLIHAIASAEQSSIAKPPKHIKLYIKIKTKDESIGLNLMVPLTKKDDMYFFVVDRVYDGESFTQDSYGRFITKGLYDFLVEAKLVNES